MDIYHVISIYKPITDPSIYNGSWNDVYEYLYEMGADVIRQEYVVRDADTKRYIPAVDWFRTAAVRAEVKLNPSGRVEKTEERVNHPSHYNKGKIEVIDFIEDQEMNFHLGNALKYITRAGFKAPEREIEDLEKAVWYIQREIQRIGGKSNSPWFCNNVAKTLVPGAHDHVCKFEGSQEEFEKHKEHNCKICTAVWTDALDASDHALCMETSSDRLDHNGPHVCRLRLHPSPIHECKNCIYVWNSPPDLDRCVKHGIKNCSRCDNDMWSSHDSRMVGLDRVAVLCDLQIALRDNQELRDYVHGVSVSDAHGSAIYRNQHDIKGSIVTLTSREDRSLFSCNVDLTLVQGSIAVYYGKEYSGYAFSHNEYCSAGCEGF